MPPAPPTQKACGSGNPIVEKIRRHAPAPDRTPGEIRGQAAVSRFDRDRFDDQPANGPPGVLVAANDERSERDGNAARMAKRAAGWS